MRFVSTHVLAPALEEAAVRAAVLAGHVYVSHDWIADPTGLAARLAFGIAGRPAAGTHDSGPSSPRQ